jgi:hypothetical protein
MPRAAGRSSVCGMWPHVHLLGVCPADGPLPDVPVPHTCHQSVPTIACSWIHCTMCLSCTTRASSLCKLGVALHMLPVAMYVFVLPHGSNDIWTIERRTPKPQDVAACIPQHSCMHSTPTHGLTLQSSSLSSSAGAMGDCGTSSFSGIGSSA